MFIHCLYKLTNPKLMPGGIDDLIINKLFEYYLSAYRLQLVRFLNAIHDFLE